MDQTSYLKKTNSHSILLKELRPGSELNFAETQKVEGLKNEVEAKIKVRIGLIGQHGLS